MSKIIGNYFLMRDIKKLLEKRTSQSLIFVEFLLMVDDTKTKNFMEGIVCLTTCLGLAFFYAQFYWPNSNC